MPVVKKSTLALVKLGATPFLPFFCDSDNFRNLSTFIIFTVIAPTLTWVKVCANTVLLCMAWLRTFQQQKIALWLSSQELRFYRTSQGNLYLEIILSENRSQLLRLASQSNIAPEQCRRTSWLSQNPWMNTLRKFWLLVNPCASNFIRPVTVHLFYLEENQG